MRVYRSEPIIDEENKRIQQVRDHFNRERPTREDLKEQGHVFVTMAEYWRQKQQDWHDLRRWEDDGGK
jgi:hypothetical protein